MAVLALGLAAEELDGLGDDLDRLPLSGPVRGVPLAPLQAPVYRDRAALLEVGGAVLALLAPDGDVEVVGLVGPVARLVLAARVDRDPELAQRGPTRGAAELGILRQVADEDVSVDVRSGHFQCSLQLVISCSEATDEVGQ